MTSHVYLNGSFLKRAEAKLSIDERGFFFGDGVYEVTRIINGRMIAWDRHAARLEKGLEALRLKPLLSADAIEKISYELIERNAADIGEGTVYLEITRGAAPRTHYFPPAETPCTIFLSTAPFTPPHDKRKTGVAAITTPDIRWLRNNLKTVNLLPAVMAKQEAVDQGAFEALFVRDGAITEGSSTNAFAVIDGELRTFPACHYILKGVTRDMVLDCAQALNIPVNETPVFMTDLPAVTEFFITATTADIMPITSIDGIQIGNGKPGPITEKLYKAFADVIYNAPNKSAEKVA